jgi:hypothetical protein
MAEIRLDLQEAEADLPPVCIFCGEPATVVKTKKLLWWPRWTYLLLLVHPFLWGIVALIVSKRACLQAPFCERHQYHWHNRSLLIWGVGLVLVLTAAAGFIAGNVLLDPKFDDLLSVVAYVSGMALIFLWIVGIAIVQTTTIRPRVITKTEIVLKGVSEAFVEALQERDRHGDLTWEETEWKRPIPADAIQEDRPRRRDDSFIDESRPNRAGDATEQ